MGPFVKVFIMRIIVRDGKQFDFTKEYMMKKSIAMSLAVLVFTVSFLPATQLSRQQAQERMEAVRTLFRCNMLGEAQFVNNHSSVADLINRDIAIFKEDIQKASGQKRSAEGLIWASVVPSALRGVARMSKLISAMGLVFSGLGLAGGYVSVNGFIDNTPDKIYLAMIDLQYKPFLERLDEKCTYLTQKSSDHELHSALLCCAVLAPFIATASLIFAGIARYSSKKHVSYQANNAEFIETMKDRCNENQVIIARLEQIRYGLKNQ